MDHYVIHPNTGKQVSIYSDTGHKILKLYQIQSGGVSCSICQSPGANKLTCPENPDSKYPDFTKHIFAKRPSTRTSNIISSKNRSNKYKKKVRFTKPISRIRVIPNRFDPIYNSINFT